MSKPLTFLFRLIALALFAVLTWQSSLYGQEGIYFTRAELEAAADSALKGQAGVKTAADLERARILLLAAIVERDQASVRKDTAIAQLTRKNIKQDRTIGEQLDMILSLQNEVKRAKGSRWSWLFGGFVLGTATGVVGSEKLER